LRKAPGPFALEGHSPSFLKNAEEQSVLGLSAVLHAIARAGMDPKSFTDWGVIASPNFLGRAGTAQTIQRFVQEGAWGVSPHLIPNQSLHAVSGTVSLALKMYGPNFGINGGPNAGTDGLLFAASLLAGSELPGLWLVLTGHESEFIPLPGGVAPASCPGYEGAALALTVGSQRGAGLWLRIGQEPRGAGPEHDEFLGALPEFRLSSFVDALAQTENPPAGLWRVGASSWVELEWTGNAE
jgi:hypothetical protein